MFPSVIPIPDRFKRHYRIVRTLLYAVVISSTVVFVLQMLFPTFVFSFDFRVMSSKNTLLDPHSKENLPATNGKVSENGALITNASVAGEFSLATIYLTLEKKSAHPNHLEASLRRSYRSFFLPTGAPLTDFPQESVYKIDGAYYALRNNILYPFVSNEAYLTRYPDDRALSENKEFLANHTVSESWIGYRVGSLLSFADGVFIVTSETEIRPVGNADTFLALGYDFKDVTSASEEEIGIYKRGRIILLGAQHPDGTLLLDQDTNTYYLVENNFKRSLVDENYRKFIMSKQTPILVSSTQSKEQVSCTLKPGLLGQSFSCQVPVALLHAGFGNDFEVTIGKNDTAIDINSLQVSFETEKSKHNMLLILSQIKQRLLSRFSASQ